MPTLWRAATLISIHVLRVEDDPTYALANSLANVFQSTSSVWRTTVNMPNMHNFAPYFNPRPPCGGRLTPPRFSKGWYSFQSTSSVWRTTAGR